MFDTLMVFLNFFLKKVILKKNQYTAKKPTKLPGMQSIYFKSMNKENFFWIFSGYLQIGTLENSEAPDVMPHNVAFHQGLHCLQ